MSFDDDIKKAQETKNQSNQVKQTSTSTKQIIDFNKDINAIYGVLGRLTNEFCEGETDDEALLD